jgi:hypothetical protein
MKRTNRRRQGKGALELIEEAVHLLRSASSSALAAYYLGSLPFVFGLLFFWTDMSHSAFARRHIAEASLGVALLFLWMKYWQAIFAIRIRAQFAGHPPPKLHFARCYRIFVTQSALQPTGLILLPLALIAAFPFGWAYAFYQNLTALGDAEHTGLGGALKKSSRQAALWPRQNLLVLAYMLLFGFFVFLNVAIACLLLPELVKMLLGIESVFTRSPYAMFNTTFFMAVIGLSYFCVDPILKTIYVLRCFYGESLQSGEDLKADLRLYATSLQRLAVCLLLSVMFVLNLQAANTNSASLSSSSSIQVSENDGQEEAGNGLRGQASSTGISPVDLDRAINQTLQERKYSWRMPREKAVDEDAEKGIIGRFFEQALTMLRKWVRATLIWLDDFFNKLFRRGRSGRGDSGYGWIWSLDVLLYSLLAVVICATAIFLMRHWRRKRQPVAIATQAIQPAPDLTDENVSAEQLPEDGWTALARELLARGEFRLALRAFYLASLAHLAEKNLVSLAKFKSNRDYERELRRRGHSFPDLLSVFGENVAVFDRSWYGMHKVTGDLVNEFAANVERIKTAA